MQKVFGLVALLLLCSCARAGFSSHQTGDAAALDTLSDAWLARDINNNDITSPDMDVSSPDLGPTPGTLDKSWNGTGIAVFDDARAVEGLAEEVIEDAAGRMVLVGMCMVGAGRDACAIRFEAGGAVDTLFADAGFLLFDRSPADWARDIAVDHQSRVVIAGYSEWGADDAVIWRLDERGGLDTSFINPEGYLRIADSGETEAMSLEIDAKGNYVIACQVRGINKLGLWRVKPDGTLDATFGNGGSVVEGTFNSPVDPDLAIDSKGRIVVTGSAERGVGFGMDMVVYRFLTDGTPDAAFNGRGTFSHDGAAGTPGADDHGSNVAVDAQDRILIAGQSHNGANDDAIVWGITPDGVLDTSFGTGGIVRLDGAAGGFGDDHASAITVDTTGRILIAGSSTTLTNGTNLVVSRLTAEGELDTAFGPSGEGHFVESTNESGARGVQLDSTGRIMVAATRHSRLAVYRLFN
ncbi:MAG: hypothetical protein JRH20_17935 [Deltaproteobacteria bacterium]|nr:hypothetical protein [Deltaproteobacteria bacterium]